MIRYNRNKKKLYDYNAPLCMSNVMWISLVTLFVVAVVRADRYHPSAPVGTTSILRNAAETTAEYWTSDAQAHLERLVRDQRASDTAGHARNVVMFLGDGMSVPTVTAARTLLGQRRGQSGEEAALSFEEFPTIGLTKTYCVDAQVPDSACTATAYLCGVKNNYGTLGVTAAVPRRTCDASLIASSRVQSIAEWALADGRDTGIVTTTRITHASPGGAFAKSANRDWENDAAVLGAGHDPALCPDIAYQLVHSHPGKDFKVILGGGRREFLPNNTHDEEGTIGRRADGRNLIEEWQADKAARNLTYKYIWNRQELAELTASPPEYLLGLFEGNHLQYHMEANLTTEPTLAELTEVAIRSLSRNEKGFFLFVESGRIDHAHHDNYPELALDETIEMDLAVQRAAALLSDEDSLIVVTADHAHVMAFNGYSARGRDVLGSSRDLDWDGVPYMTLSYTNGPGFRQHQNGLRPDVTVDSDFRTLRWMTHVDAPLESETHGGDDVAVFARGPHHELFTGLYEQSHIPHRMAYAACIGPGLHACSAAALLAPGASLSLLLAVTLLVSRAAL